MEDNNKSFLGKGWTFPPSFDAGSGTVNMVEGVADINESLDILLSTSLGERVMQPQYGCNLNDYMFESTTDALIAYLKDLITRAIRIFEARIQVEKIEITPADSFDLIEGRLTISVDYFVASVNSRFNYVYDFYLREANEPI